MIEKQFGKNITLRRKQAGLTQDELAALLYVSSQAISKWENGHSLPETALLPDIAKSLGVTIDELFSTNNLIILEAIYGDGIESFNVTKKLSRLIENESINIPLSAALLGYGTKDNRASFLLLKYQTLKGICYAVLRENENLIISSDDVSPISKQDDGLRIVAGCYGNKKHNYDVMQKLEHYKLFNWNSFDANHEIFPSNPANDETEYLTLVYINSNGLRITSCAEEENIFYNDNRTELIKGSKAKEFYIKNAPVIPPFGSGMECSWAAALTKALQTMNIDTDYTSVMGVSGACYRLAFCWDFSAVDGLVVYDYATPGYYAYGFTPEMYCHIEKPDRPYHRERIIKEIRTNMPVLGINLRIAPEWGFICGYKNEGEEFFCRTKFDIENTDYLNKTYSNEYKTVDNWPFLLCYFTKKQNPPSFHENLIASLNIFVDCAVKSNEGGYAMGFNAYEVWISDLKDNNFYENCNNEQFTRRFMVDQFCMLALFDARTSASEYLCGAALLLNDEKLQKIADIFTDIAKIASVIHKMLDSGIELGGEQCRAFWTIEKRIKQAELLSEMMNLEKQAYELAEDYIKSKNKT